MSANSVPRFIEQPKGWMVEMPASTPAASVDGSGTLFTLVEGGEHGSKVDLYRFTGEGAVEASRLFIFLGTGVTTNLLVELGVAAASAPVSPALGFSVEHVPTQPHIVPSGWSLFVGSAEVTNVYNAFAFGGDY